MFLYFLKQKLQNSCMQTTWKLSMRIIKILIIPCPRTDHVECPIWRIRGAANYNKKLHFWTWWVPKMRRNGLQEKKYKNRFWTGPAASKPAATPHKKRSLVRSPNFNFSAPFDLEIAATLLIHPLLVGVAGISRAKGASLQGEVWRSYGWIEKHTVYRNPCSDRFF